MSESHSLQAGKCDCVENMELQHASDVSRSVARNVWLLYEPTFFSTRPRRFV